MSYLMDKLNSLCKVKFLAHITLGIYSGRCLFNEVQHGNTVLAEAHIPNTYTRYINVVGKDVFDGLLQQQR